ncbi:MAG: STAS domain-containing protein [Deltaproteobacteria bacterium]|nr:STAS domain-containing protein [Deltaproteobacteria bacterium]
MDDTVSSGMGMHIIDHYLIVPVSAEINDQTAMRLRQEILAKTESTSPKGMLLDVSAIRVLDSFTFSILTETAKMVSLLGAKTVFVGFQAGVASALIDLDVDLGNLETAVTLEDAFELLRSQAPTPRLRDDLEVSMSRGNSGTADNDRD